MKITDNKVQNIKPLEAYLYTNLLVSIIFLLFNPMYALLPILLISLVFGRINEKLIGFLFVISITLMFANQVFAPPSDIASYIHMYQDTKYTTFSNIFYEYIDSINGHELLWFYYSKLLGSLFGYSNEIFILSNYLLIFSLLTYVSYLSSENGRYNFVLILFGLVFLEVTLFSNAYDLWRTEIASLIFVLSLLIGYSNKSKYLYRVVMYSTIFVHTSMLLLVLLYELYSFFLSKKVLEFHGILFYVKFVLFSVSVIILLTFVDRLLPYLFQVNTSFLEGYNRYSDLSDELNFNVRVLLQPLYILVLSYIIFNYKYIRNYETFSIFAFIVITAMPFVDNTLSMFYYRASIVPLTIMTIMGVRFLKNLPIVYSVFFIFIVFLYRFYLNYLDSSTYIVMVAKGEMLSLNYGLLASIFYFYDPIFRF